MAETELPQKLNNLTLSKTKQKKRKQTNGQLLRNHLTTTTAKLITTEQVLNVKVDKVISKYFLDIIENKNINVVQLCKENLITFKKFKERYFETRNEKFKPIVVRNGVVAKTSAKKYNDARFAIKDNIATAEQIELVMKRRNGVKKALLSKNLKRYGQEEGMKRYDIWLKKYESEDPSPANLASNRASSVSPNLSNKKKNRNKGGAIPKELKQIEKDLVSSSDEGVTDGEETVIESKEKFDSASDRPAVYTPGTVSSILKKQ